MNGTDNSAKHYDMVVIGSGSAGNHGAIQAAKLGKKVAVVERFKALGAPVSIPARFRSRHFARLSCALPDQGVRSRISASDLAKRIEEMASNEVRVFEDQFRRHDIDVLSGTASFAGPHIIRVTNQGGERFCDADYVLIATGSRPAHDDAIPVDGVSSSIRTRFAG